MLRCEDTGRILPGKHNSQTMMVLGYVEQGITCRKTMAQLSGMTPKQVRTALDNLYNSGRIEIVDIIAGGEPGKSLRIYGPTGATEERARSFKISPVWYSASSVFAPNMH